MKKQLLAAILTTVGMVGLTYSQNAMFQATPEPTVRQQISETQKQFANCINQTKKSDEAKVVNNELFEIVPKSDHKMNLFTTENKITDEEARALTACKCRQGGKGFIRIEELMNNKLYVAQGRIVLGHITFRERWLLGLFIYFVACKDFFD